MSCIPMVLLMFFMMLVGPGCSHQALKMTIQVPSDARIQLDSETKIAVFDLLSSETRISPGRESAKLLRENLSDKLGFSVMDGVETSDWIKKFEKDQSGRVFKGTEFFQNIGREMNIDVIIGGTVSFMNKDLSGYERREYVNPRTGSAYYRDVWVERLGLEIDMEVYLVRVSDGEYLLKERFTDQTEIAKEDSTTPIYGFYHLIEQQISKLVTQLSPQNRSEIRYILR